MGSMTGRVSSDSTACWLRRRPRGGMTDRFSSARLPGCLMASGALPPRSVSTMPLPARLVGGAKFPNLNYQEGNALLEGSVLFQDFLE